MSAQPVPKRRPKDMEQKPQGITALRVAGFKSIVDPVNVEIRPLTLLAGANSSGKSSLMQPLLLLKQTLESSPDPGPLRLHDSHVRFTAADQFFSRNSRGMGEFQVGLAIAGGWMVTSGFRAQSAHPGFDLGWTSYEDRKREPVVLRLRMSPKDLEELGRRLNQDWKLPDNFTLQPVRRRCFVEAKFDFVGDHILEVITTSPKVAGLFHTTQIASEVLSIFHVPGLRGNPERAYRTTSFGPDFPGTFEQYVASLVFSWQQSGDPRITELGEAMESLHLTWKVQAKPVDATQVEMKVGRLPRSARGGTADLVNVADVGFGVSQVLPVVVALLAAEPGQLVYLEQPEIHLHPRAQDALADLLVEAAKRGVRVVAETHSSILLRAVQARVAEGAISSDLVKLHWFQRQADGSTKVTSADLDAQGAYGEWPEDFGDAILANEGRYLDAAMAAPKKRRRE